MYLKLFVCLVLLTTILAEDYIDPEYESTAEYKGHKHKHIRKFQEYQGRRRFSDFFADSNDSTGEEHESENKFSGRKIVMYIDKGKNNTNNNTTKEIIGQKEKNGTTVNLNPITEKEGINAESSQTVISFPPYATYEVTENTIDIPDDRLPIGPIVSNFTYFRPQLNTVQPVNNTDEDNTTEPNINTKTNRVSIFHFNAEFDDNKEEQHVNHNKVTGIFKGIKDYIHSVHRGIVKGIHKFFHKHDNEHDNDEKLQRDADDEVNLDETDDIQNVDQTDDFVH